MVSGFSKGAIVTLAIAVGAIGAAEATTLTTSGQNLVAGERNAIDQPPTTIVAYDIDGTAVANILLSDPSHVFTLNFSSAITSFFADFARLNDDGLNTEILVNGTVVTPSVDGGVRGFGFISDTAFNLITVRYVANDGFAMDNVAYGGIAAIPLPASLPLLLAAVGAVGLVRRRRRRAA
jgi:hypothetical protein